VGRRRREGVCINKAEMEKKQKKEHKQAKYGGKIEEETFV
jgi:hypothetical protein